MKTIKHSISKVLNSLILGGATLSCLPLTSCGGNGAIQFANFESYMAEDLMDDLQSNYAIQFPNFTVTEMIETKFEKYYDIAVPSCYEMIALVRRGWVEKVDWKKFEVQYRDDQGNLHDVETAEDAKHLFKEDVINKLNTQFGEYILACAINSLSTGIMDSLVANVYHDGTWDPTNPTTFNVLNYGVPYFSQTFTFCYKGTKIDFYKSTGEHEKTESPTWADIFYTISPANPNLDPRFKEGAQPRIGLVDDAKTMYDVSRIIETTEEDLDPTNEIPEDNSTPRMLETFNHLTSKFEKKNKSWFIANSDSGIISKLLADPKGTSAALSWSGDAIYGAQGAEEYEEYSSDNFHIQKPSGASLDETEFVVMNKKNVPTNPEKQQALVKRHNNIYEIVKQVCLDGCDADIDEIARHEDDKQDNRFKYWTMVNFDSVYYTPTLKNIYQCVTKLDESKQGADRYSMYWRDCEDPTKTTHEPGSIDLYIDILTLDVNEQGCNHLFGRTITALENSNNHWAWLESRAKL